jgi:hypothetical protein
MFYDSVVSMLVPLSAVALHFSLYQSLRNLFGDDEVEG